MVCYLNLNSNCIGTLLLNPRVNPEILVAKVNSSLALFRQELCNLRCENSGCRENRQVIQINKLRKRLHSYRNLHKFEKGNKEDVPS